MKITKFGQCCLLIEIDGKRVLTDPGNLSQQQNHLREIDLILITHEHADHLHTESLQLVLANNPHSEVVTNTSVGAILTGLKVAFTVLEGREAEEKAGLALEAHDGQHAEIYEDYGQVQNTGYFIAQQLFYPGDAYTAPNKPVPVLALPVAGPWCRVKDAVAYAKQVNPAKAFPVHDGLLTEAGRQLTHRVVAETLKGTNIEFTPLDNNETGSF